MTTLAYIDKMRVDMDIIEELGKKHGGVCIINENNSWVVYNIGFYGEIKLESPFMSLEQAQEWASNRFNRPRTDWVLIEDSWVLGDGLSLKKPKKAKNKSKNVELTGTVEAKDDTIEAELSTEVEKEVEEI